MIQAGDEKRNTLKAYFKNKQREKILSSGSGIKGVNQRPRPSIGQKRDSSMPNAQSNIRLEPIAFKLEINEGTKKDQEQELVEVLQRKEEVARAIKALKLKLALSES